MNAFLLATLLATGFSLPESQSADTEVSTNVEISVAGERFAAMHFQFDFVATPTNDLEVLVGYDANVDGDLSPEEAAVTFGYDAGVWFQCETAANLLTESVAPTDGRWLTRDFKFWRNDVDPSWNLAKVVRRGKSILIQGGGAAASGFRFRARGLKAASSGTEEGGLFELIFL